MDNLDESHRSTDPEIDQEQAEYVQDLILDDDEYKFELEGVELQQLIESACFSLQVNSVSMNFHFHFGPPPLFYKQ